MFLIAQRSKRSILRFGIINNLIPVISSSSVLFRSFAMALYKVEHNPSQKEFFIPLGDAAKAVLQYENESEGVMDLWHTEVPVSHRGQKIGALLAKAALDFAVDNDISVRLTCTYLQKYVKDHPEPQYMKCVIKS